MCMFCDAGEDGYVNALNKDQYFCIWNKKIRIRLYGKFWDIDINFCPMCGSMLKENNMVHVKKCPCERGRGKPTTEFSDNGKPQIYCMGWVDNYNDEPLECCKNCDDWVYGEQCEKDFDERLKRFDESLKLWKDKHTKEQTKGEQT